MKIDFAKSSSPATTTQAFSMLMGAGNNIDSIKSVDINKLAPYSNHPFKLYEGDRLDDMIASIQNNGILTPLIVREKANSYEILAGHNRANAAKLAGFTEVPVIVKKDLTDEDALIYVIETNLMQRSFTDMLPSEQATILSIQHSKMFSQGKRNDIILELKKLENPHETMVDETCSPVGNKLKTMSLIGHEYELSKNSVARLLRVNKLITPLKTMVDNSALAIRPAVSLSYLSETEQTELEMHISDTGYKVDMKKAEALRSFSESKKLTNDKILLILSGEYEKKQNPKSPTVKIKMNIYSKYFNEDTSKTEIENTVEQALELYFSIK